MELKIPGWGGGAGQTGKSKQLRPDTVREQLVVGAGAHVGFLPNLGKPLGNPRTKYL